MSGFKGNTFSQNMLDLVYQAATWTSMAINATASPFTNIYAALSTGTLTAASDQTTTEATYTGYARVAVVRTSSGWHRTSQTEKNVAAITFGACTAGSSTVTDGSSGTASSGADTLLHGGPLGASLAITSGITPSFAIDAFAVTES